MNQQMMEPVYVGLDTHRKTIYGSAINKEGETICSAEFNNNEEALKEFFKGFYTWNTEVVIEACNFWRGPYKILHNLGYKTTLANPTRCRQMAKEKKTDKFDSRDLANLKRVGYLPEVFILSPGIIALRDLTRHRCKISRMNARVQNLIKSYLSREGIKYDDNIWTKKGIQWLRSLEDLQINDFVNIYELNASLENQVIKRIKVKTKTIKAVELLRTIPGIGEIGAPIIYSEIGDISRFKTVKDLHAYAGVVPGTYQSGTKTKQPKRKQINYWLKFILGQCSGRIMRIDCKLQKYYFKIYRKKGWKTARKATARKMLTLIWHVLNEEVPYHDS